MQQEQESFGRGRARQTPRATLTARTVCALSILTAFACTGCNSPGKSRPADAVRKEIVAAEMRMYEPALQPSASDARSGQSADAGSMRTTSRIDGGIDIVDIFAPAPVGGLQLVAPAGGWPPALHLRFHQLKTMQGFTARSRVGQLNCEVATPEMKDAPHLCTLGGEVVDALTRTADGFVVRLPSALLSAQDNTLEIRWVERYR